MAAQRRGLLILLTCFYGLLPSSSRSVQSHNVLDAQPRYTGWQRNSSAQQGLHAAISSALKYLDASSNLSGRIISYYIYSPQLRVHGNAGAVDAFNASSSSSSSSSNSSSQLQRGPGSQRLGGDVMRAGWQALSSPASRSSKGLWRAALASMLASQQPAAGNQASQWRYLQQLGAVREQGSRLAGLMMLDGSAWAKAPAWELLQQQAPAAALALQRLCEVLGTHVSGASGAAVTVASALVASKLLMEML